MTNDTPHSYEVTEIELIESSSTPSSKDDSKLMNVSNNSITGTNLLNGVEKSYRNKKKNIWSASEVQNDNSAVISDGLQSEPNADNGSTSNGTPSNSIDKDSSLSENNKSNQKKHPFELSEVENLPEEKTSFRIVYHGSGAEFDKFDHAKMGSGAEGNVGGEGTRFSAKKKKESSKTVSDSTNNEGTVTSAVSNNSNSDANIQDIIDILKDIYEKKENKTRGFITTVSRALGLEQYEAIHYGALDLKGFLKSNDTSTSANMRPD